MKKFHVFAGLDYYYPCGSDDYRASYELLDDAVQAGSTWCNPGWYEILETLPDGSLALVTSGRRNDK